MALQVDLFWSFRSPYSYLVLPRVLELRNNYEVEINARVVLPLAVRDPERLKKMHPLFLDYMLRDIQRIAEYHGMEIASPDPDPVDILSVIRGEDVPHPRIERLMRLAVAADERGRGLEFIDEASRLLFGGTVGWDTGEHLAQAAQRAGLELDELDAVAISDADRLDAIVEDNHEAQATAGHWGVPLMVFDGEPFFGQDRFDLLVWRLKKSGLKIRE